MSFLRTDRTRGWFTGGNEGALCFFRYELSAVFFAPKLALEIRKSKS